MNIYLNLPKVAYDIVSSGLRMWAKNKQHSEYHTVGRTRLFNMKQWSAKRSHFIVETQPWVLPLCIPRTPYTRDILERCSENWNAWQQRHQWCSYVAGLSNQTRRYEQQHPSHISFTIYIYDYRTWVYFLHNQHSEIKYL